MVAVSLLRHATRASLAEELECAEPHVFHFTGHGDDRGGVCGIALERSDGTTDFLPAGLLREMLGRPGTVRAAC